MGEQNDSNRGHVTIIYSPVSMVTHENEECVVQMASLVKVAQEGEDIIIGQAHQVIVIMGQFRVEGECKLGTVMIRLHEVVYIIQEHLSSYNYYHYLQRQKQPSKYYNYSR